MLESLKKRRFGIYRAGGISLNLVQRWIGPAQLSTTSIYANAVRAEEQISP